MGPYSSGSPSLQPSGLGALGIAGVHQRSLENPVRLAEGLIDLVRGNGRNENVLIHRVFEDLRAALDPPVVTTGVVVDYDIPGATLQRLVIVVAVADQHLHVREFRLALAAGKYRDLVATLHGIPNGVGPDKPRAAEDQNPPGFRRSRRFIRRPRTGRFGQWRLLRGGRSSRNCIQQERGAKDAAGFRKSRRLGDMNLLQGMWATKPDAVSGEARLAVRPNAPSLWRSRTSPAASGSMACVHESLSSHDLGGAKAKPAEQRQAIHEELPPEMIHLVLEAHGAHVRQLVFK